MYVKITKRKDCRSVRVQIAKSYRNNEGKPRHKVMMSIGSAPPGEHLENLKTRAQIELNKLLSLSTPPPPLFPYLDLGCELAKARLKPISKRPIPIADAHKIIEHQRISIGLHEVVGALYDRMNIADVFTSRMHTSGALFRQEIISRLAYPRTSKLFHAQQMTLEEERPVSVSALYRMMDTLTLSRRKGIQNVITREVQSLLGGKIDVVFFDATTFHFHQDQNDEDLFEDVALSKKQKGLDLPDESTSQAGEDTGDVPEKGENKHSFHSLSTNKENQQQMVKKAKDEDASQDNAQGESKPSDKTAKKLVEEGLRKKGLSKNGLHRKTQVVLALIQGSSGLPLGYHLFPGNTADVSTLEPAIEALRKRYKEIDNVVFVADAGMLSKSNLAYVKELGAEYVVAARLRSLNQKLTKIIIGKHDWTKLKDGRKLVEYRIGNQRLILRYCPDYAARMQHKRDQQVEKAKERIKKNAITIGGRGGRYIKMESKDAQIDEEAIARDKKFDGLHGVWTSLKFASKEEIYQRYSELWEIEESFRVMKTDLGTRPTFHWKPRRIHAHFCICFVAFALVQIAHYCYHLQYSRKPISKGRMLREIRDVEVSIIEDTGNKNEFLLPSSVNDTQTRIYHALGLKLQTRTVPRDLSKIVYNTD